MEFGFSVQRLLLWIVLFPLVGAALNGFFGRRLTKSTATVIGIGSVALSFALAVVCASVLFFGDENELRVDVYEWFSVNIKEQHVPVMISFVVDRLSAIMLLVVTGIGLLIHVYSYGYMHDDAGYRRFFAYLNLFMASMLILILASSFPLLFVGWEGVGLCSYLLIGYWWENPTYAAAGRKAFVVNRIGDFGVLLGMFLLATSVGSFEFHEINAKAYMLTSNAFSQVNWSIATIGGLLLLLGCAGKSAQIPLYVWLPDAMAGPTPVSALIHAATMVTAGVYLCCRVSNVFAHSPVAMATVALIGTATALLAASIALVQQHMKKVLAYSTVSQLGFMFAAVGVGAFGAGLFHVFTHAFFKACLFLGAGSVMHAVHAHGDADLRQLGGLRSKLPKTHWTFLVSCLAIAGVPGFSGFFSKDEILLGAVTAAAPSTFLPTPWVGVIVFWGLALAATMTAFYMFRLYFLTFAGQYRGEHTAHESPPSMTVPLAVLGVGAIGVGYLGLPHALHLPNVWAHWLEPFFAPAMERIGEHHGNAMLAMLVGTFAAVAGIGLAYLGYGTSKRPLDALASRVVSLHRWSLDAWRVDAFYNRTVVAFVRLAALIAAAVDQFFVDVVMTKVPSWTAKGLGWLSTRLQTGVVFAYGATLTAGFGVVLWWVLYPQAFVVYATSGSRVSYRAGAGLGYEYRWDFDSDGSYETDWEAGSGEQEFDYRLNHVVGVSLLLDDARPNLTSHGERIRFGQTRYLSMKTGFGVKDPEVLVGRIRIEPIKQATRYVQEGSLPTDLLGEGWRRQGAKVLPPVLHFEKGRLRVDPGGARVTFHRTQKVQEFLMKPGEKMRVGTAFVSFEPSVWIRANDAKVRLPGQQDFSPSDRFVRVPVGDGDVRVFGKDATYTLKVQALSKATVMVRNVFGNVARWNKKVEIDWPEDPSAKPPSASNIHSGRVDREVLQ